MPSKNAEIYRQKTWTFAKASGNIRRETSRIDFLGGPPGESLISMKGKRCLNLTGNMNDIPQCDKPYNIRSSSCSTRVLVQVCIQFCFMPRGRAYAHQCLLLTEISNRSPSSVGNVASHFLGEPVLVQSNVRKQQQGR